MEKNKEKKTSLNINFSHWHLIGLFTCLFFTGLIFLPTLNRPWLLYDERILYKDAYFATPIDFFEIFEIISKFGLNFNVLSSNSIYTSNYVVRSCPLSQILGMITTILFNGSSYYYHLFNYSLHCLNTIILFFILKSILKDKNLFSIFIISTICLIWSIHPIMIESILLTTNFGASLSYMFFFLLLLDFLYNREKNKQLARTIIVSIIYLIPMLTNEYIISLPLVFFTLAFYLNFQKYDFKTSLNKSINDCKPYFITLFFYIIYFFLISSYQIIQTTNNSNYIISTVERIFWLSPQIFFHHLKLLVFPKILTVDQSSIIILGKTLLDPYSVFCIAFLSLWLFIPAYLFLLKKRFSELFLLTWSTFFAFLPFSHILAPSYILGAERYLYIPLASLLISFLFFLSRQSYKKKTKIALLSCLILISMVLFLRSKVRTKDWLNNNNFISATYKSNKKDLYKAVRAGMFGYIQQELDPNSNKHVYYFNLTLKHLELAKSEINNNPRLDEPEIIKAYGLDNKSLLTKIAFLEAKARCFSLEEKYYTGINILKPFIKDLKNIDPSTIELYTKLLVLNGNYSEAKEILLKTNSIHPDIPIIIISLFDYYIKVEKNLNAALSYIEPAVKKYPFDTNILFKTFLTYKELGKKELAAQYAYLYGLRLKSKFGYQEALELYLDLNDIKNASKTILKLERIDPKDADSLFLISKYYYKIGAMENALKYIYNSYKQCLLDKNNPDLTFDSGYTLARILITLNREKDSISIAKDLLPYARNNIESLKKLAKLYHSLKLTTELNTTLEKINSTGIK